MPWSVSVPPAGAGKASPSLNRADVFRAELMHQTALDWHHVARGAMIVVLGAMAWIPVVVASRLIAS